MTAPVTTDGIWREVERNSFAVLSMVTARGEARSAGVVYVARQRRLYVGTRADSYKARHVAGNPNVSVTVAIPKRIPFLPWIRIPAATITFQGKARVLTLEEVPPGVADPLFHGVEELPDPDAICVIAIEPAGRFVTYGVGVSTWTMRDTEKARGRAPV